MHRFTKLRHRRRFALLKMESREKKKRRGESINYKDSLLSIDTIVRSCYAKYLRGISYNQPAHFFKLFINLSKLAVLRAVPNNLLTEAEARDIS